MSRSCWKICYFKKNIFKSIINIKTKSYVISSTNINKNKLYSIYNGKTYQDIVVNEKQIGSKFGEFILTKKIVNHGKYLTKSRKRRDKPKKEKFKFLR